MSPTPRASSGAPHWLYSIAHYLVRVLLGIAATLAAGLTSIEFGFSPPLTKTIPLYDLIQRYPGPAIGLGSALLLVSVLAVLIDRRPDMLGAMSGDGRTSHGASGAPVAPSGPSTGRRLAFIGTIVLALLSLGILATGGVLIYTSSQGLLQAPARMIAAYCSDITNADPTRVDDPHFEDAWRLLSAAAQHQAQFADSATNFEHLAHLQSVLNGPATSCGLVNGPQSVVIQNNTASGVVRIIDYKTYTGAFHLVYEQNTWRLDYVDQSLLGTNVLPLGVAEDMCNDFVARNFGLAWNFLTTAEQARIGTVDDLAAMAQPSTFDTFIVDFAKCSTTYQTYAAPKSSATTSSVVISMTERASDAKTHECVVLGTFDWTFTMTEVNFVWQVSDFSPGDSLTSFTDCAGNPLPTS